MIDTRIFVYLVWGLGCLVLYSIVLWRRFRSNGRHHDSRSRRDLIAALALWLVAFAAAVAVWAVLFGEAGTGIRGFASALALGAFAAAGIVLVTESESESEDRVKAKQ